MSRPNTFLRCALAVVLLAHAAAGIAGDAAPRWRDKDPAAQAYQPPPFQRHEYSDALEDRAQRHPDDVALRLQRAYDRLNRRDVQGAQADLDWAAKTVTPNSLGERRLWWTLGWVHFDLGDPQRALEAWQQAVLLHGGQPYWAPYTFAIAQWQLGQRDEAVASYQRAVGGYPKMWTREGAMQHRTRHWKPTQREAISAVFDAWKQQASER